MATYDGNKAEFLAISWKSVGSFATAESEQKKNEEVTQQLTETPETTELNDKAENLNENPDDENKKRKADDGQFKKLSSKKRHQENHLSKEERLCSFMIRGDPCPYGDSCQYQHDLVAYMKTKPADLEGECYQFKTYGYCCNGVACRFSASHINVETGENIRRSEEQGGVIEKEAINTLKKDVQLALRKKNYNEFFSKKAAAKEVGYDLSAYPDKPVKLVDFSNKVYIAPLTTVGNLPYRRVMKDFGADITCGEMAMLQNLEAGQASEWALLRRHRSEEVFGVQLAGSHSDAFGRFAKIMKHETETDFVDVNCGCPLDIVCNRGCGSSLMNKRNRIVEIVSSMAKEFKGTRSITVKIRTGWDDKNPTTHKLLPLLQKIPNANLAALMVHGRSRLQRYSKLANWDYVLHVAQSQSKELPRIPVIGNGDIFSWQDWKERLQYMEDSAVRDDNDTEAIHLTSCAMLGRGALIKPWLPREIKEQRMIDISASERLDMLKSFCNYGFDHWGSDQQGINTVRRFLLEWMSFLHRYVPLALVEAKCPQKMSQRPPAYFGRCDLETLMASPYSEDWIKLSEMLLGPVPSGFAFVPKHKSNSYSTEAESISNG